MLSKASKDVLAKVRQMVPPMLESFHKGALWDCLRIGDGNALMVFQANWGEWPLSGAVRSMSKVAGLP